MTIFAIYRVLKGPYKPNLDTITSPFNGEKSYLSELENLVPKGMEVFSIFSSKIISKKEEFAQGLQFILKAAPNAKVSASGLLPAYLALQKLGLLSDIYKFANLMGNQKIVNHLYMVEDLVLGARKVFSGARVSLVRDPGASYLGKLSFKEEAAGKLRVFALVDVITQSTLKQLHEVLFSILRNIPNDGTFDQEAAFSRAQTKASVSKCSFGYDLSSATDRLPLSLQTKILSFWFGQEVASS